MEPENNKGLVAFMAEVSSSENISHNPMLALHSNSHGKF
jgi:hypothetical protein